jgi:hypothetical protein
MGAYSEIVTVGGLERPVLVDYSAGAFPGGNSYQWLKQVEPQDGVEELPDDFSAIFRANFGPNEVSMGSQVGSYGTIVPISEFLLLTSEANAYEFAPTPVISYVVYDDTGIESTRSPYVGYSTEVPGALAYNVTTPIIKTSAMYLEVLWELRS